MLHEHAVTYDKKLTIEELNYIVKKANKLGKIDRDVLDVHEESDEEGTHVYFNVTGMRYERRNN